MVEVLMLAVAIIAIRAVYLWIVRGKEDAKAFFRLVLCSCSLYLYKRWLWRDSNPHLALSRRAALSIKLQSRRLAGSHPVAPRFTMRFCSKGPIRIYARIKLKK